MTRKEFVNERITQKLLQYIETVAKQLVCEHKWEEFKDYYKCSKCDFYFGELF